MREKIFNKDLIIEHAMHMFWTKGYHQTSIQDLVKIVGFNRAGLYDAFGDKETLFKSCFMKYREEILLQFNDLFNQKNTSREAFNSFFEFITNAYFNDPQRKGCLICNTYVEFLPSDDDEMKKLLSDTREMITDILYNKLKQASGNNELNQEINHRNISNTIYSSMVGVAVLSKTNIQKKDITGLFATYLNIFK